MDKSLNKYISETGFCSRREADHYIDQGRVTINDRMAIKGNRVNPGDVVEIDGEPIKKKDKPVYMAFNKPVGITCTTDLKDKSNIISFINYKSRIFPIGRLDKPSEGLIFLTNDGDIVNKILRAGNNHEKEYTVTVNKPITGDFIHKMSNGVKILDIITKKCFVKQEGKNRFRIILTQGVNRQIRRMCTALGYEVETLRRTRIMHITLAALPTGKWRHFTPDEIKTLQISLTRSIKTADATLLNETSWNE
jgi:23S rRNA pseudouridine2604 synthase